MDDLEQQVWRLCSDIVSEVCFKQQLCMKVMNCLTFRCWITHLLVLLVFVDLSFKQCIYLKSEPIMLYCATFDTNNAVLCHFEGAAFWSSASSHLLWNRDLYSLQHFHWETNYRNLSKPVEEIGWTDIDPKIHKTLEKAQNTNDATTPKKHHQVGDRSLAIDTSPLLISLAFS